MLKLVILAQEIVAETTLVHPTTMVPNGAFTLHADGIHQGACTGVRLKALPAVADPRLAVITDGTDHLQTGGEHSGVLDHAVTRFQHTLLLATLGADRQALDALAKIAKGTGLLLLATFLAVHWQVTRLLRKLRLAVANLLLAQLLLLCLLALTCFLLRHSACGTETWTSK